MRILSNTCIRAIYDIQKNKIIIKSGNKKRLETDDEVIERLKKKHPIK